MAVFDAFMSYSHAADGQLAPSVQIGLQRLAKKVFARRALRVFRDQTGLSTNPHLWGGIEAALLQSEWFVLLASPESAASEWVNREVATWLDVRPLDRLMIVMTDGHLDFDADGRVDRSATDCLPPRLVEAIEHEPRWLDLRWARDETQLDLRNGRFRAAIADLAAPMHGVAKDDLESDDVTQQRRARRLAFVGIAAVVVLAVVAGATALIALDRQRDAQAQRSEADAQRIEAEAQRERADAQRTEADAQRIEAEAQRERADAQRTEADAQRTEADAQRTEAEAQRERAEEQRRTAELGLLTSNSVALRGSRLDLAALLAVEAHRFAPSAATESALFGLFTAFPGIGRTVEVEGGAAGGAALWLPDGNTIALPDQTLVVRLIDVDTGRVLARLGDPVGNASVWLSASPDGRYLASAITGFDRDVQQSSLAVWDLQTRQRRFADVSVPIDAGSVAINADGSQVAVAGGSDARTLIYDAASGELQREIEPVPRPARSAFNTNTAAVTYAPDGRLIVTSQAGPIRFLDADTGAELSRIDGPEQTSEGGVSVNADGGSMTTDGFVGVMRYALASGQPLWAEPVSCEVVSDPIVQIDAILCLDAGRMVALDLDTGTSLGPRFDARGGTFPLVSPDGTRLLVLSDSGTMTSWQLDGGGLTSRLLPRSDHGFVTEYSPDGAALLVNTATTIPNREPPDNAFVYTSSAVEVVDARTGDVQARIDGAVLAHFSDDPRFVIARFEDGTISRYDLLRQQPVGTAVDVGFAIEDFTVSGDRLWVWSEFGLFEGRIASVDLDTGAVDPLIETGDGMIRLYAPRSGQLYTTSASLLLHRRDPSSGEPTGALAEIGEMVAGERVIVAQTADRDVVAVDPATLVADPERFPSVGGAYLNSMDLSDDDRTLLVAGDDRQVRLYDVASRTQLGTDIAPDVAADAYPFIGPVWTRGAAIRDDGRQAATTTADGIVVWDLDPDHWSEAACELASRNLTQAEWDTYIGDLAPYRATCPNFA